MIPGLKKKRDNENLKLLRSSGLIKAQWYLQEYEKGAEVFFDPIAHYYHVGWREGKNPNPYFETSWYLDRIGDSKPKDLCPLVEYILTGGRDRTSPGFDPKKYSMAYELGGMDPLSHYIQHGVFQGNNGFPAELNLQQLKFEIESCGLFVRDWYLAKYPDVRASSMDPLDHYCRYGWKEGRQPNYYFDPVWYSKSACYTPEAGVPELIHYFKTGWRSGVNPSGEFDIAYYLASNPDVKEAGIEPLKHFIEYGQSEGRQFRKVYSSPICSEILDTGLFLGDWYVNFYEDLRGLQVDPLEHFVETGMCEGRNPNPYFDTTWYLEMYSEEIPEDRNPVLHYAKSGWKKGHNPSLRFDSKKYHQQYLQDSSLTEPLSHYLKYGKQTGLAAFPVVAAARRRLKLDPGSTVVQDAALRPLLDCSLTELRPCSETYNPRALNIHWVMPDFSPGAGGHMTIFRIIRFLEFFGHKNTIWIYNPVSHSTESDAYDDIVKHFQVIKGDVRFVGPRQDFGGGDVIFATDWSSVSHVLSACRFKRRFYFVQDHEPEFYPQGSRAIAAKMTYEYDLDCICASPWLRELMQERYGRWAEGFWLSADRTIYSPEGRVDNTDGKFKIAFYARHFTSRRAVELGFLALEALAKKGIELEVHCFGASLPFSKTPFECIDHGVLAPHELASLYRECDLGVVFSATNYSLIPQEMMACGLPVAELDGESTRAIFPRGVVTLLSPNPRVMADELAALISDQERLSHQRRAALDWVGQFTWEQSARDVESAVLERLKALGFCAEDGGETQEECQPKASVVIPTWNGGEVFRRVIEILERQKTPWPFEVLVVDSGSEDGTAEFVEGRGSVRLHRIPNSEFQHGRTRNLGISLTSGEYIAILTQDALPKDEYWLYNLVTHLEHFPDAAGAFGKHLPWPDADPFTKRDLHDHFHKFLKEKICVSRYTDPEKWENSDISWKQFLHFYSDNNSCMRRSVWEKIPYPEIDFGEDQAWAWEVIKAGYSKVYACQAVVYHSHDFDEGDVEKRAYEEGRFFRKVFGYQMENADDIGPAVGALNERDQSWGTENGVDAELIDARKASNASRLAGYSRANREEACEE